MKAYLADALVKKTEILVFNSVKVDIEISWADGMIGAMPVFDTRENALKYGATDITEIDYKEREVK